MTTKLEITDSILYTQCMERLKRRINSIHRLLQRETNTGALITDVEFMALQLRKVLEGIALASICAHREEYERLRNEIWKDWNARLIFKDIERINPSFYPTPLENEDGLPLPDNGARPVVYKTSGFLTKNEYLKLYKKTASLLHEDNPFAGYDNKDIKELYNKFPIWVESLTNLLNKHAIHPKSGIMWIVQMHVVPDEKVHVTEFTDIGPA